MELKRIWAIASIACAAAYLIAAQRLTGEVITRLDVKVVTDAQSGQPVRLLATGEVLRGQTWLGVSLYPASVKDVVLDGKHYVAPITGEYRQEREIPKEFAGGTYAAAIWRRKVAKADCKLPDCRWCALQGFHMEEQLELRQGALVGALAELSCRTETNPKSSCPTQLVVSGELNDDQAWLGCSLYPPLAKDAVKEGLHEVVPISRGPFKRNWQTPERFAGGTYEVAVWRERVEKKDCKVADCWGCATFGYHLQSNLSYQRGALGDPLVANVKTQFKDAPNGPSMRLHVSGVLPGARGWLGCSFYPPNVEDVVEDSVQRVLPIGTVEFDQTIEVPDKCREGTYEVALWRQQVKKADCQIPGCLWCKKNGYHMEDQLAYLSGKVGQKGQERPSPGG